MKLGILAAAATAAFVAAAPSYAVTNLGPVTTTAAFSATVAGPTFADDYIFTVPGAGTVGSTVITINLGGTIALTSVLLNSTALNITNMGGTYIAMGTVSTIANPQTLRISGTGAGSYGGTVGFTAAVPEAATWTMMVLGFGAIGGAMRTSRRKVVFA